MPELPAMSTSVDEIERRMLSSAAAPTTQAHPTYAGVTHAPSQPPQRMPAEQPVMSGNVAVFFAHFGETPSAHAPAARVAAPASSVAPQPQKQPDNFDAANFFAKFQVGNANSLPPMPPVAYAPTAWGGVQPAKPSG